MEDELVGFVLAPGTRFNNPMKARELTWMAFIFWQSSPPTPFHKWGTSTNIYICSLHFVEDHLKEANQLAIPQPPPHVLVPEPTERCLLYRRLLTSLIFWARANMSRGLPSALNSKNLDCNVIFYKPVLRENKKRKTNLTSSYKAPLEAAVEEDEDALWDNLEIRE